MKNSQDVQPRLYTLIAVDEKSEIKDDFKAVSQFPFLLGHPVADQNR